MTLCVDTKQLQVIKPILLKSCSGLKVTVLPLGGIISSIRYKELEVTLGYDNFSSYLTDEFYLGATVGRYANRIAGGKFQWLDTVYQVSKNQGDNCLHGGNKGFNRQVWQIKSQTNSSVTLYLSSPDGDQGFPGEVQIYQTISVIDNQVNISFEATSNKDTVINLTNHCYFNLNTDHNPIDNHLLQIFADHFIPTNDEGIPSGVIESVENSCFDFKKPQSIKNILKDSHPQIKLANGLDHCFVNKLSSNTVEDKAKLKAKLFSPQSGVTLDLYSSQLGVQVYTGNFLTAPFNKNQGVCLEAQNWPDAPNHQNFPSATLIAGEKYKQEIIYAFS